MTTESFTVTTKTVWSEDYGKHKWPEAEKIRDSKTGQQNMCRLPRPEDFEALSEEYRRRVLGDNMFWGEDGRGNILTIHPLCPKDYRVVNDLPGFTGHLRILTISQTVE